MSVTPSRPKLPVTLIKTIGSETPISIVRMKAYYKDADGYLWMTDHLPCFYYDMNLVQEREIDAVVDAMDRRDLLAYLKQVQ
jgi:ligand-binding sensor domain-containing protein